MNPRRIYAIFLRQLYLVRGNATRFVQIFVWITVDILLWGFITKYLGNISNSQANLVPVFLGAILLWNFLIQVMQGLSISFFEDVWSRNFLNIFASPLKISEYLAGLILTGIGRSLIALIAMLLLASLIFGLHILVFGISLAAFLLILFLFGISLGIIGVAIVLRFGPSAEWFIWPIPAFISPFVGVLYPINVLPRWMQYVSKILPPSYVFENVRAIVNGGQFSSLNLVWGIILAVAYIILAYIIFVKVFNKAVRSGLLARYNAEDFT